MFWKCIPGLHLNIKLLFDLDADLLHYCWNDLYSETMTIRTYIPGIWKKNPNHRNNSHTPSKDKNSEKPTSHQFFGGGKALLFSSDELFPYALSDWHEQQYQFLQCVRNSQKQNLTLDDDGVFFSVPLNILAPKLILKAAKELANCMTCICVRNLHYKMHKYCCKIANVKLVKIFLPHLDHIK
jgi:hypothetical protein